MAKTNSWAVGRADASKVFPNGSLRIVVLASLGGGLEFYDFIAYGIFAATIAPAFFPAQDALASYTGAFAVFAAGYAVRPLGGIVFSHFGDRIGRRTTFLMSLLGISLATGGMALCPTHTAWGGWATVAFTALRLLQGFCLGGELPGAVTYVSEAVVPNRKGRACGLLFCCASGGVVLASGVSAGLHAVLPEAAMAEFGWRIAFGLGSVLGLASYLPRRALLESPVFAAIRARHAIGRVPLLEVLQWHLPSVTAGVGVTAIVAATNGILFAYLPAYLVRVAGFPVGAVATAITIGVVANAAAVLAAGALCDVVPARTVHRVGCLAMLAASWPFFWAVSAYGMTGLPWLLVGFGALGGVTGGAFAVLLVESFPARVRFSGVALAFNLSFALFSGAAPVTATRLIAATGDRLAPSYYLCGAAFIALAVGVLISKAPGDGVGLAASNPQSE
jgi:MHS family proline/betaine transporter-like MFS transporter